ncbi:MAG: hypothetical protein K5695_09515 [Oscillospiraceae bacterium]|nr:hypothetical protein [Oscillospiraceae bacterium]
MAANESGEYVVLDTKAFDAFLAEKDDLLRRYDDINNRYDAIVSTLLDNWVGQGAMAFYSDAKNVKANISGIYDILKIMCDTLTDCRQVFDECDRSLGDFNRNPESSS